MEPIAIIENYIDNVAANLPGRLRNDVGLELRSLLSEQLQSAAADAGRPPDREMAVALLRSFGRPDEVALRYSPQGFELVEPRYSPLFVKLASFCVAVQWAATLPLVFSSQLSWENWWLRWGFTSLSWVGFLTIYFSMSSWIQRRFPVDPVTLKRPWTHWILWLPFSPDWRPGEPRATDRRAAQNAAPLGAVLTLFFVAPAWVLNLLLPAGTNTSGALYDHFFQKWLLPPLITLMTARLVLLTAVVLNERWRHPTEVIRVGLWICNVAVLYWAVFQGPVFAHPTTDALFRAWLLVFLIVNTIQVVVWIRRSVTRVRIPKYLARPQKSANT